MQIDDSDEAKLVNSLTWEKIKPLVDETSIKTFEVQFQIRLPEDFKQLAPVFSGSSPSRKFFRVDSGEVHVIDYFLSFNPDDKYGVFKTTSRIRRQGLPGNIVPFAIDPFGNYICIESLSEESRIVYWDHEEDTFDKIAVSFRRFLANLY